jgi:hypothetical protein
MRTRQRATRQAQRGRSAVGWAAVVPALLSVGCAAPYSITWSNGPTPPKASAGHVAVPGLTGIDFLGGTGGGSLHLTFDPRTNTWREHAGGIAVGVDAAFAYTSADGPFIAAGAVGWQVRADCHAVVRYNPPQMLGRPPPLPAPRAGASAAIVEHVAYVLGGAERVDRPGYDSAEMFRLDLTRPDDGWVAMGPMPGSPRRYAAAVALRGRLFVFGGVRHDADGRRTVLGDARRYDPREDRWAALSDLPEPLYGVGAVALDQRYILLLGGAGQNNADVPDGRPPLPYRRRAFIYDVLTDVYHRTDDLPRGVIRSPPVLVDGKVYVFGGEDRPGSALPALQVGAAEPAGPGWWR